jgi:hypothetical protein
MKQTTIIRHDVRHKASLTISEYVVLAFLDDMKESSLPINDATCEGSIHVSQSTVRGVIADLMRKGYVITSARGIPDIVTTEKWSSLFTIDQSFVTKFLQPIEINDKRVIWGPSSRRKVEDLIKKMPHKVSITEILDGKIRYFCFLAHIDYERTPVAAEVFIGHQEKWKSDWWIQSSDFVSSYRSVSKYINPEFNCEQVIDAHREVKAPLPPRTVPLPEEEEDPRSKMYH